MLLPVEAHTLRITHEVVSRSHRHNHIAVEMLRAWTPGTFTSELADELGARRAGASRS